MSVAISLSSGGFMHVGYTRTALAAATAGGLALAGLAWAAPALAAPMARQVPCSPGALSSAISGAADGDVLQLATNCTYWLTSALPSVTVPLTIDGTHSTLRRSPSAPEFSLLTVATGGNLTVQNVNFSNGATTDFGGGSTPGTARSP